MITDKICYIHFRHANYFTGNYEVHGGATVAWVVDKESGDIYIGKPAQCSNKDVYVKYIGRDQARINLFEKPAQFIIKREALVAIATQQALATFSNVKELTPSAANRVAEFLKAEIAAGVENFMGSHWYEQVVRAHFTLVNGKLEIASEALSTDNFTVVSE